MREAPEEAQPAWRQRQARQQQQRRQAGPQAPQQATARKISASRPGEAMRHGARRDAAMRARAGSLSLPQPIFPGREQAIEPWPPGAQPMAAQVW